MTKCIHIFGGSGSGTTTLGAHLALALDVPHADADDYFWMPTDPPYQVKRPVEERIPLMDAVFAARKGWVLSGSVMNWGNALMKRVDLAVQLTLDPDVRMARLMAREQCYGERISDGGDMAAAHRAFIDWARSYDDDSFGGRSRAKHDKWAAGLPCPVLALDGLTPTSELVRQVLDAAFRA